MAEAPKAQFDLKNQFKTLTSYCNDRQNVVIVFPVIADFDDYLYQVEHHRIHAALDGLNYATLDLLDVFGKHEAESLIMNATDRVHPNAVGVRLAAQATLELLAKTQLAPVDPRTTNAK